MIIPDVNILLYAYEATSARQRAAEAWLEAAFRSSELIGLSWLSIWGFLRIRTNPRLAFQPKPLEESFQIVREWLALPGVMLVQPGPRHFEVLEKLVLEYGVAGPMMTAAALAALAMEQGATLASTDRGFGRFTGLRWVNPLA